MQGYVRINDEGVCVGTALISGKFNDPNHIPDDNPESRLGMKWTGTEWVEPEPEAKTPATYTARQISRKLTPEQKVAIRQAANEGDVVVQVMLDELKIGSEPLNPDDVSYYVGHLVATGVLTQVEAAALLGG